MKNLNRREILIPAATFLVGTFMGKFLMIMALILIVVAGAAYGIYSAKEAGLFEK